MLPNKPNTTFVQIGGNFKSGTSLLSSLFDNHPNICAISRETGFNSYLYSALSSSSQLSKNEKLELLLSRHKKHNYLKENADEVKSILYKRITQNNYSQFQLYWELMKAHHEVFDKRKFQNMTHWVDKSPLSHFFASEILENFPNAKFIHLVREPKNNLSSIWTKLINKNRTWKEKEAVLYKYHHFSNGSLKLARINQQRFGPEKYKVIRFEDLCQNPEHNMQEICSFIGLEYSKILLKPTQGEKPYEGNNHEGQKFTSVSNQNINRWKERMPDYPAAVIEYQTNKNFEHFGYQKHFNKLQTNYAYAKHCLSILSIKKQALRRGGFPLRTLDSQFFDTFD